MKEDDLLKAVRAEIDAHGLYGYHPHDSRRDRRGWPDFVIVGKRIIYRELKTADGQLTSDQTRVKYLIIAGGGDFAVWRPTDLTSGRIARELAAVAR